MKFTRRQNGSRMATVKIDFHLGWEEFGLACALLLQSKQPVTTGTVESLLHNLLFQEGDQGFNRLQRELSPENIRAGEELAAQLYPDLAKD